MTSRETTSKNLKKLLEKAQNNFGQIYNILFLIYSWLYSLFLQGIIVGPAQKAIFYPKEVKISYIAVAVLGIAMVAEMIGVWLKMQRIQHIKAFPEQYSDFYQPDSQYFTSDYNFLMFISMLAARAVYAALLGITMFRLIGWGDYEALGALLFMIKDGVFFWSAANIVDKPPQNFNTKRNNIIANTMLLIWGFVSLSFLWEAFLTHAQKIMGTIRNWQGFGELFVSFLGVSFLYFLLYFPTRAAYYLEEVEFTSNEQEVRDNLKSLGITTLLSVLPWLI